MFYRDFSRKEIHDLLHSTGFTFNSNFKFPSSGNNQAYVFAADGPVLVDESLGLTHLLKGKSKTDFKKVERKTRWKLEDEAAFSKKIKYEAFVPSKVTNSQEINILKTWQHSLSLLSTGRKNASKYHKLIYNILVTIIGNRLKNPRKEEYLAKKSQRVDITFRNERENGFFKQLAEGYHITCTHIFIECKNYDEDIGNPEFGQIVLRLNDVRGQFGIIVCRKIVKTESVTVKQEDITKKVCM